MRRLVLLLVVLATARDAAADCLPVPPVTPCAADAIYLQVGDTQLNLMKRLGRALRDNTSKPLTLAFVTSGSCTNITAIYTGVKITSNLQYIPSKAEDPNWVPSCATWTCSPPAGGIVPDVANSALFNSACTTSAPPANMHLETGPTQAYVFAVPKASTQTAITFEEAYFVFGFGAAGMVQPWVDEASMFIRTVTKSTLLSWAANITVPAVKWKGMPFDGSPMVVSALQGATNPEAAIGILGAEVYDANRTTLSILAYRSKGQYAAYYPDSTSTARDKKNVRDGHYTVWSPTIWMDTVDLGTGLPTKPDARYVIDLIAGKTVTPLQSFPMIDIITAVGLVPDCAMGVTRSFEGGPLSLYTPSESCTCKYDSLVATTACAVCDASTPCAAGTCRNGFCEAR